MDTAPPHRPQLSRCLLTEETDPAELGPAAADPGPSPYASGPSSQDPSATPRPHPSPSPSGGQDVSRFSHLALSAPITEPRRLVGFFVMLAMVSPISYIPVLSWKVCLAIIAARFALPPIIRLRYPHFMRINVLDDLRINAGATLSLFASITAPLLQVSIYSPCISLYLTHFVI